MTASITAAKEITLDAAVLLELDVVYTLEEEKRTPKAFLDEKDVFAWLVTGLGKIFLQWGSPGGGGA